jgi:predicted ATPase/DNA-binding SARP family transcriptional activator
VAGNPRFGVLGPLQVVGRDGDLPLGGPRQRTLLSVLLLESGRAVSRSRLIDELWGDDPPPTAVNTLQVHTAALRRALGGHIRTVGSGYALDAAPEQVDAARFDELLGSAALVPDPARRAAVLREALALWRGQPFADVPRTPAIAAAAARLEEQRLAATEERVEADLAGGRHEDLVAELRELVAAHPERERLAGQLMLALHRCGRGAEALDVYAALSSALDRRLGVDPSDELAALERAVRRADPTLAAPTPASLPAPASRFIGRRRELAETADLLGRTRLLTLVGPGGCGKTRLAVELAAGVWADHPDGAHFADLAQVADGASVTAAVASALRVRQRAGEPVAATLAEHVRHRRLLLVLDNCEHVLATAAELAGDLLEASPGLRVLATSRQPLGLPGETVWRVPSLGLPPDDADPHAAGSDAVRLLADRAASALPGHELGDAPLAAAVCRRLDALPLAIELVAGRLSALTLAEVAAHLDRRLALLAAPGSGRRHRHETMDAAIDWSHALLDQDERVLFRRLSVFVGSFCLEAAEAVAGDAMTLPVLLRLVDKSMVVAERSGAGATRYRLLETIRDYAADRLDEAGEAAGARARHARWYQDLAEASGAYPGVEREAALDPEAGNIRAALAWCLAEGRAPEQALAIAAPIWWYWWLRGASEEGRDWLLRCLAAVDPSPTPARALGLRAAAALARATGDHAEGVRLGEECLAASRALDDRLGLAAAFNGLCITESHRGNYEVALCHADASLAQARAAGSRAGEATSLNNRGTVLRCLGRLAEAEEATRAALRGFRETGNRRSEGAALNNLGMVARLAGDLVRAREWSLESLAVYRSLRFAEGQLDALRLLAALEQAAGRPASGLLLQSVADREADRLGTAALTREEAGLREAVLRACAEALGESERAGVLARARRTGLDAVVAELSSTS